MEPVRKVSKNGEVYALIFGRDLPAPSGIQFATTENDGLQVGFFERAKGYHVAPHRHLPRKVDLKHIAEFLSIEKGKVEVTVFDEEWGVLGREMVRAGECIVFLRGGHELIMLEPTRILEVKQGPFPGTEKDKIFRDNK